MLNILSNKKIIIGSGILTSIMFIIVMFFVNPMIDSSNGLSVIQLQLAFDKKIGIDIVKSWGDLGVLNFNSYIFTDYIYAFAYSLFFASLLSMLMIQANEQNNIKYTMVIKLALIAGFLDWIENTIELAFINNLVDFSDMIFTIHSIVASLKWFAVPIVAGYIVVLVVKIKNK